MSIQNVKTNQTKSVNAPEESHEPGQQEYMLALSAGTVREYDNMLATFKDEMTEINEKKSTLRAEREKTKELEHSGIVSSTHFKYDENGEPIGDAADGRLFPSMVTSPKDGKKVSVKSLMEQYGISPDRYKTMDDGSIFVEESVWDDIRGKIDNKITAANATSETKTIYLQALMDGRRQALMLLSNLVSAENSTKMAIIQNMKG